MAGSAFKQNAARCSLLATSRYAILSGIRKDQKLKKEY
jgi:hypothetical protein